MKTCINQNKQQPETLAYVYKNYCTFDLKSVISFV